MTPVHCEQEGEMTYARYVSRLSQDWNFLQRLNSFMDPDLKVFVNHSQDGISLETPQSDLIGVETRLKKIDVIVVDVISNGDSKTPSIQVVAIFNNMCAGGPENLSGTSAEDVLPRLKSFLCSERPKGLLARLYLVEDLSRDVIEHLGSTLQIDPHFFAFHARRCRTRYVREQGGNVQNVAFNHPFESENTQFSDVASRPYFHLEFRRGYQSVGEIQNAIRFPHNVIVRSAKLKDDVSFVKEKISVFTSEGSLQDLQDSGMTMVIIFDPTMRAPFLSGGAAVPLAMRCPAFPKVRFSESSHVRDRSLRFEFIDVLQGLDSRTAEWDPRRPHAYVIYTLCSRITAEWSHLADLIERMMVSLEKKIDSLQSDTEKHYAKALNQLQDVREESQSFSREFLYVNSTIRGRLSSDILTKGLDADLVRLMQMGNMWQTRTATIHKTLVAWLSIQESKAATEQGENLAKLTQLGFFFIPLSCVATVLGMGYPGPMSKYWIFAVVAIPLTLLTMMLGVKTFSRPFQLGFAWRPKRNKLIIEMKSPETA